MKPLDFIYSLAVLVLAPFWLRKKRGGWKQRLGHVGPMLKVDAEIGSLEHRRPRVLLHAVSVGEVSALRSLVAMLASDHRVIVSATTDTGLERARSLYGKTCEVVRFPLDFSWAVERFLDAVRPDVVAMVELELWPQFIGECRGRGVPTCVINGRLSERSFKGYRRMRRLLSPMFASLEFAAVQDDEYAQRFIAMGVTPDRAHITGSMKWDNANSGVISEKLASRAEKIASNMGIDREKPLVVAGSTGPGEESMIHRACAGLGVQLLCAPRKPERFDEAAEAMRGCVRRSETKDDGPPLVANDRFLLDTIGELAAAYALADVVVVGRSFGDLHGSDPTEPIGLGRPTIIGPAAGDFSTIVRTFEGAGGIVRASRESLGATIRALLDDPERAQKAAQNGVACIETQRGASSRHADLIRGLIG